MTKSGSGIVIRDIAYQAEGTFLAIVMENLFPLLPLGRFLESMFFFCFSVYPSDEIQRDSVYGKPIFSIFNDLVQY